MSKNSKRRKLIFDKYSNNLHLLNDNNLLEGLELEHDRTYICPICLNQFSESSLNQLKSNPLTLEDVPPKSLGGSANVLTCKDCNSFCGHNIDYHLVIRLREIDSANFEANSEIDATFERNGKIINGKIRVEENGSIIAVHSEKNNNPNWLKGFINSIIQAEFNNIVKLKFKKTSIDIIKLQIALMKIGYLQIFEKFGYSLILNSAYNIIRNQLLNAQELNFANNFWFLPPYREDFYGIYIITHENLESLLTIYPLKTKSAERPFATIIPLPIRTLDQVTNQIRSNFGVTNGGLYLQMNSMNDETNYLTDLDAIARLNTWIDERTEN